MKTPTDLRSFLYSTAEFVVRPYEVACPRCTAQPWALCFALSRAGKTKPSAHPARIAAAQRATKYHVYEMGKGRCIGMFSDVPSATKFARQQADRTDVEDIDAGTLITLGTGPAPDTIRDHADVPRAGMVLLQTFYRPVTP